MGRQRLQPHAGRGPLDAARQEPPPPSRWGRSKSAEPSPTPDSWFAAEIAVLDAEGLDALATDARWRLFERTLSDETLRSLLAGLADFEDVVVLDRAFELATAHPDPMKGLDFLMNWPAQREAASLILARRQELRGAVDDTPLWAARLASRYPDAALLLVRARATALVRLGSGMTEEIDGLIAEAETLAASASDPGLEGHADFVAGIERQAAQKRPAWR